jgi:hypothetical protein
MGECVLTDRTSGPNVDPRSLTTSTARVHHAIRGRDGRRMAKVLASATRKKKKGS